MTLADQGPNVDSREVQVLFKPAVRHQGGPTGLYRGERIYRGPFDKAGCTDAGGH